LRYFDSSYSGYYIEFPGSAEIIANKIEAFAGKRFRRTVVDSPQQRNGIDCGVFTCANAEKLIQKLKDGEEV